MSKPSDPIRFSVPKRPAADKKKKLGRGLGALLGETQREEPLVRSEPKAGAEKKEQAVSASYGDVGLASLPLALIEPLPGQPRTHFDEDALDELAASISARGVIQPIIVRPRSSGGYQLVAGERRWRAAQKARLHEIPAIIRDLDEREVLALALIENIQREDLNPIEEARAYHRLSEEEGLTQAEIAEMVDKSRSHIANLQRLLALPPKVLDLVEGGALSMGHARALIGNDDALELAKRAVTDNLSVREVEALARNAGSGGRKTKGKPSRTDTTGEDADIAVVERHLEELLGLSVKIRTGKDAKSGDVTIRYRTLDQLDLVCQRLSGGDI